MSNTIIRAVITPSDPKEGRYQASCTAQFDDGASLVVLEWYDDELTITESEFIGLTRRGVQDLFFAKDQAYLQAP